MSSTIDTDYRRTYPTVLERLKASLSRDAALRAAVGGNFLAVGQLEFHLLRSLGLCPGHFVVDIGCGSGRLAMQLAPVPGLSYLGTDILDELLVYAREITARSDFEFKQTDGTAIPTADECADFVCFFSVFTHLVHEDSFRYLREAKRVLRPGGHIILSFLEFHIYSHWAVFDLSLRQGNPSDHLNQFMSRDAINAWAHHLDLKVVRILDGDQPNIPIPEPVVWDDGRVMRDVASFGQSVAILARASP